MRTRNKSGLKDKTKGNKQPCTLTLARGRWTKLMRKVNFLSKVVLNKAMKINCQKKLTLWSQIPLRTCCWILWTFNLENKSINISTGNKRETQEKTKVKVKRNGTGKKACKVTTRIVNSTSRALSQACFLKRFKVHLTYQRMTYLIVLPLSLNRNKKTRKEFHSRRC